MTDHPPIAPDAIRIIVHIGGIDHDVATDLPIVDLPRFLADMEHLTKTPMPRNSEQGALVARQIFQVAARENEFLVCCLVAAWIALYGDDLPPGFGLSLDDLREAAGAGTLSISVNPDCTVWDYLLQSPQGGGGGSVTIDVPRWAKAPMGSA